MPEKRANTDGQNPGYRAANPVDAVRRTAGPGTPGGIRTFAGTGGVRVTLFGELQFFPAGEETPRIPRFDTQKSRLLLAYLLRSPGQGHNREVLATQFWPESPAGAARRSLRDALRFIRFALTDQGIPDDGIEADRNTIRLRPGAFATDAADFDAAHLRAMGRLAASDVEMRLTALEEMVSLYRSPFLTGHFDLQDSEEWIEPTRRRYAAAYDDALCELCALYASQGDLRQALQYARLAADNDPSEESRRERVQTLTEQVRQEEQGYLERLLPPRRRQPASRPRQRAYLEAVGERNTFLDPGALSMEMEDYERALGQLRAAMVDAETPEQRFALAERLLFLGKSCHARDRGEGAMTIAACEDAYTLFLELDYAVEAADALLILANASLLRGNRARSLATLDVVTGLTERVDREPIRYDLKVRIGEFLLFLGDYRQGRAVLEDTLRFFRQGEEMTFLYGTAFSLRFLGMALTALGKHAEAIPLLQESAELLVALQEPQTRAAVLGSLGDVYVRDGNPHRAIPYYQEGLEEWQSVGQSYWTSNFKGRLARAYLALATDGAEGNRLENGRNAERLAEESLDHLEGSNGPIGRALPLYVLGWLALRRSDYRKAEVAFGECLALRRRVGDPLLVAEALEAMAFYYRSVGDTGEAVTALRDAITLRETAGTPAPPQDRAWIASLLRSLRLPPRPAE